MNIVNEEAGLLGHEATHAADQRAGGPQVGRVAITNIEERGVMTQAEVANGLDYNTIYGTWSQAGYNTKAIENEITNAVDEDCSEVGSGCQ